MANSILSFMGYKWFVAVSFSLSLYCLIEVIQHDVNIRDFGFLGIIIIVWMSCFMYFVSRRIRLRL